MLTFKILLNSKKYLAAAMFIMFLYWVCKCTYVGEVISTLQNYIFKFQKNFWLLACSEWMMMIIWWDHSDVTLSWGFLNSHWFFCGLITFKWSTVILWLILDLPGKFYTHSKLPGGRRSFFEHYAVVQGFPPRVMSE